MTDQRGDIETRRVELPVFPKLALTTAFSVFVMNIIGSYVSSMGAGLACPEWPLCPSITNYAVLLEFLHRVWGGVVAVLAVATLVTAHRFKSEERDFKISKTMIYIANAVLIIQILLGAVVVFSQLRAELVALHQALAMTIFALFTSSASISLVATRRHP